MNLNFIKNHVRASYNAILPASVRYDVNLSDKAKLLYAEITANFNHQGYCDSTNQYFASIFAVSQRTISNYISDLFERSYIDIEFVGANKRRIKLPSVAVSFIQPPKLKDDSNIISEEQQAFLDAYLDEWAKGVGVKLHSPKSYYAKILALREHYSEEDMRLAMKNRIEFVNESEWHKEPANRRHRTNIDLLLRDEETFTKCLNMISSSDVVETTRTLSSFDFN